MYVLRMSCTYMSEICDHATYTAKTWTQFHCERMYSQFLLIRIVFYLDQHLILFDNLVLLSNEIHFFFSPDFICVVRYVF